MNWRAREGIVDVMVGRLTHGSAPQLPGPLQWHGCLASTGIASWHLGAIQTERVLILAV